MNTITEKSLRRSRVMYIFEAALEYLISILVSGSFLASLTRELGMSDSLTGILSSVISLGCLFQLLSLPLRRTAVKRMVIFFSIANQVLFMLLYVVPLTDLKSSTKIPLFVVLIFSAYVIYNMAHPKKISWMMSSVDKNSRGSFTAKKEIISLISGIVFSFGMGALIDRLFERGMTRAAFALAAAVIFLLMVLHSLTMLSVCEKQTDAPPKNDIKAALRDILRDKNVRRITVVFLLYYVSTYAATPFYGTYQIGELGLSLKYVSAIAVCGSLSRITVSRFWGKYADKNSFAVMIEKCFVFLGIARLCVVFAVPASGKVMFVLYYIFHGIALGGINSALTNLIFERLPAHRTSDALAITQACAGTAGFLTTLCISPLVTCIQNNGNSLLGVPVYAQQVLSALSLAFVVLAIVYTRKVFIKNEKI